MMGTSKTMPLRMVEIVLMEHFGWTERQLYEEVSVGMFYSILDYLQAKNKAEEQKAREAKMRMPSHRPPRFR